MYAKIEKSGCGEYHGNVMVRFAFYLEPNDARYEEHHIFAVDETTPEFKAGYQGKVDKLGNPVSDKDFEKWINSCKHYWRDNPFHNHFVYADPDVTDEELQSTARFHLANFYEAWRLGKTIRSGWATEHRIRPLRYEEVDNPEIFSQRVAQCEARVKEIKDLSITSFGEGETFPATDIDIGSSAANRTALASGNRTYVVADNPANATGILDTFELWFATTGYDCKVGTFSGSGTSYDDRDYETIGTVVSGSKQTFSGKDCDVTTGDYIGVYFGSGTLEASSSGYSGLYYISGDQFGTGAQTYTLVAGYTCSLYGTGETPPPVSAPTVTTQAVSSIQETTATGNGNITDNGGEDCDYRGIAWDTVSRGDPGGLSPAASAYANYNTQGPGSYGTGAFTRSLTGLPTGDTIYGRAYAHNSAGWNWGSQVSFLTKPAAPTNVAATTNLPDKVTVTWTKSTGATGYKVYEGVNLLDTLGDVATYDDTDAGAPTVTPGDADASDGSHVAHVALSLSGQSGNNGASRTYKVVALNATGDSDDSDTDIGYRKPGALTYQWQRSSGDADADYGNIDGATTASYNDTGAPANGVGRYYRCVVSAEGAA